MLSFRLVQLSRVREMHFIAMTGEKHDDDYEHAKQCDRSETICSRPALSRRNHDQQPKQRISNCADDETRLKSEPRQQNESGEQWTNCRAGGVKQRGDADAIHSAANAVP